MALTPGARLGAYEVVALIGAGGMGEVYRARDTRLGRDVAIKILPELFAADADRVARFAREAQVLASLNHPHIAQIYGLEETGETRALVLELVEGPTLADRIAQGPIPVTEALPIAKQIAEALEAAHEQGIIHRDLKPANIKLTNDGTVKVLDFGLAKAFTSDAAGGGSGSASISPTLTTPAMTAMGMILGTAAYMAPEQAKGKPVDKRADIWGFGCVLYEMLTGRRPFLGEDVPDVVAGVLARDPDYSLLPASTPDPLRNLLRRCLAKDRRQRLPDIAVARLEIDDLLAGKPVADAPAAVSRAVTVRSRTTRASIWLAVLISGAVAGTLVTWVLTRPAPAPISRFAVVLPPTHALPATSSRGPGPRLALSPDGRTLVYAAARNDVVQLYRRPLDQLEAVAIPGTEDGGHPFFSPDGQWLGFIADMKLKKISLSGGPAITICDVPSAFLGASWGPDDQIVFSGGSPYLLFVVAAAGGAPKGLTRLEDGETGHRLPHVLPDGKTLVFTVSGGDPNFRLVALSLTTGKRRAIVAGTTPRSLSSGELIFQQDGSIWAARFDPDALQLLSEPVPIVQGITVDGGGEAEFAVSQTGTLTYLPAAAESSQRSLVWVNRQGREEPINAPPRAYTIPRLSPDGGRVALDIRDQENDVWIWDFARATLTRITFDPGIDSHPIWTLDGRRVVFASTRAGVHSKAADGTGTVDRVAESANNQAPTSFSPDGKQLVVREMLNGTSAIAVVPLEGERRSVPLINTSFNENNGQLSPDGRWLAYQSNESGRFEIYVRPFPKIDDGRWQISTTGGSRPVWARNGRELFYLALDNQLMAVPIAGSAAFSTGSPVALPIRGPYFLPPPSNLGGGRTYDVSPDGRRFLLIKEATEADGAPALTEFAVVLNWHEELKRLLRPN